MLFRSDWKLLTAHSFHFFLWNVSYLILLTDFQMRPAFYNANDNQNYFVNDGRTSSRVSQAPGGRSSINLSWDNNVKLGEFWSYWYSRKIYKFVFDFSQIWYNFKLDKRTDISNNSFANGASMNNGNVLTERPSSRVLMPPGGKSSVQFFWVLYIIEFGSVEHENNAVIIFEVHVCCCAIIHLNQNNARRERNIFLMITRLILMSRTAGNRILNSLMK